MNMRVICFHNIEDKEKFRERMRWVRGRYNIVSLSSVISSESRCQSLTSGEISVRDVGDGNEISRLQPFTTASARDDSVAVTFDDGYAGWMDNVVPVLRELKIPAVFFVNSGAVDGERVLGRKQDFKPLTSGQLRELAQDPLFEIGGHTTTHRDLGQKLSISDLEEEIIADKAKLELITGKPAHWFAYPYGRPRNISPEAVEVVKRAGYQAGFTIVPGRTSDVFSVIPSEAQRSRGISVSGVSDGNEISRQARDDDKRLPRFARNDDRFVLGRDSLDIGSPMWWWRVRLSGWLDWAFRIKAKLIG
ncbi:MAG: polysaccharide deacetylase family protein [Patescibacteria group bacterium]